MTNEEIYNESDVFTSENPSNGPGGCWRKKTEVYHGYGPCGAGLADTGEKKRKYEY